MSKKYKNANHITWLDAIMIVCTGGLWFIWIVVKKAKQAKAEGNYKGPIMAVLAGLSYVFLW